MSDAARLLFDKYLPAGATAFVEEWSRGRRVFIKIKRERQTKLGDYRRQRDGQHLITINHNLPPELFFFVLTHEFAHLLAFEKFGFRIAPHGPEWKQTYRQMLGQTDGVYSPALAPLIRRYAQNPKANFSAFAPLAKILETGPQKDGLTFVEAVPPGGDFIYRQEIYRMVGRRKINYLCQHLATGRGFIFRPAAAVEMIIK